MRLRSLNNVDCSDYLLSNRFSISPKNLSLDLKNKAQPEWLGLIFYDISDYFSLSERSRGSALQMF